MPAGHRASHDRTMSARSTPLLLAVTLTLVVAAGALLFGAFLLAIAAGLVALLSGAGPLSVVGFVGGTAVAYGLVAIVAAAALWTGRAWSWPLAAAIHLVALVGVLVALSTGGFGSHIVAGLALSLAGLAALVSSNTRAGLGRTPAGPRGVSR
jgi:hypothetical protein